MKKTPVINLWPLPVHMRSQCDSVPPVLKSHTYWLMEIKPWLIDDNVKDRAIDLVLPVDTVLPVDMVLPIETVLPIDTLLPVS